MQAVMHVAISHWLKHGKNRKCKVAILLAPDEPSSDKDIQAIFEPWKKTVAVVSISRDLDNLDLDSANTIWIADKNFAVLLASVESRVANSKKKIEIVYPEAYELDSWGDCVIREVAHHDFEHGGLNQWDGAPVKHAPHILQMHSRNNCRLYWPAWALHDLTFERRKRVIDLGCGPITHLRWGVNNGLVDAVLVDPLMPVYELILAKHGLDRLEGMKPAATHVCLGEEMGSFVPRESIDVVYTSNAIDHTREPLKVISEAEKVLRPGGRLAVGVATHEGTKQGWDQFHKTDIYVRNGKVVFNHQNGPIIPLLSGRMRLTKINSNDDVWLTFIAEKV